PVLLPVHPVTTLTGTPTARGKGNASTSQSSTTAVGLAGYATSLTVTHGPTAGTSTFHVGVTNDGPQPGFPHCVLRDGTIVLGKPTWSKPTPLAVGATWTFARIKPTRPGDPTVACT